MWKPLSFVLRPQLWVIEGWFSHKDPYEASAAASSSRSAVNKRFFLIAVEQELPLSQSAANSFGNGRAGELPTGETGRTGSDAAAML